jgi:AmmeMemoRadiSam system protein B/AmmeMemoRadiSam system protein A
MPSIRPAAVAGLFYPADPRALAAEVDELIGSCDLFAPRLAIPKALIVPHAGYVYSGAVAAHAYDDLAAARGIVRRVVLLGPVHRVAVRGLALPAAEFFETPLGRIAIDAQAVQALSILPQIVTSAPAHAMEHSIEVQLPFLQKVLGEFSLVPLAVGAASVAEVAEVLERLWGGRETLIVISTDLSHYHAYEDARRIDGATLERIGALADDLDHEEACGATPLNGLLWVSRAKRLAVKLLAACNSGDTAGDKDRVVGYSSFALYPEGAASLEDAGRTLLSIARESIENSLFSRVANPRQDTWLQQPGATFVTLSRNGALRGCIGSLEAARPVAADVAGNALAAAFRDPRFPALTREEWPHCRVEVSLLSVPRPLHFADDADLLERLRPGEDGIILECGGRRATFLPQVWESIPDKGQFMRELARKAGLAADARLARCRIQRYRVSKWQETAG